MVLCQKGVEFFIALDKAQLNIIIRMKSYLTWTYRDTEKHFPNFFKQSWNHISVLKIANKLYELQDKSQNIFKLLKLLSLLKWYDMDEK